MNTAAVRVQRQNESALRIAQFLAQHSKVRRVHYPFLEGHPQRAIAMEQMRGGGGMFSLAPSLGGVDSLVSIPVLTSHAMISADQRQNMGVTEQLIRVSVGIENVDDLIADLEQAFAAVSSTREHARVG